MSSACSQRTESAVLHSHEKHVLRDVVSRAQSELADLLVATGVVEKPPDLLQFLDAVLRAVFDAEHVDAQTRPVDAAKNRKFGAFDVEHHEVDVPDADRRHDGVEREALDVGFGHLQR